MGGKTAASSSQLQIPPEVMAQYRAVNTRAEQAAAQPFQAYSNNPDAFVAPLTATQQAAIGNINNAQGMATPYFNAATQSIAGGQAAADPLQRNASYNIDRSQGLGAAGTQQALRTGNQYTGAATQMIPGAVQAGQSYLDPATQMTMASGQRVDPTGLGAAQIGQFMDPFRENVVQSTMRNLQQQQGQEQSSLQGDQIMRGSFGGSRADLGRANLARQQDLASGQVLSNLYSQGYGQALGAAQRQQDVQLGAGQANRAALGQAGSQLAGLGQQAYGQQMGASSALQGLGAQAYGQQSGAANALYSQGMGAASAQQGLGQQLYGQGQQTAQALSGIGQGAQAATLAGAQAQLGAGTAEQQTQQAGTQAMYNQFLQQQGYPFQVAQFLGNIAMGTGALSGSTTTGQTPMPFFSDKRLKEHAIKIGKTYDGQNIYKYKYKGSPHTQIGLMAQEVEKKRPEAVGEALGFKTVDYDAATKKAERKARAEGGPILDPGSMQDILRMQQSMYPFGAEGAGRTGGGTGPHGMQLAQMGGRGLQEHAKLPQAQPQMSLKDVEAVAGLGKAAYDKFSGGDDGMGESMHDAGTGASAVIDSGATSMADAGSSLSDSVKDLGLADMTFARGGLATMPGGYKAGGMPYGDEGYVPFDEELQKRELEKPEELKAGPASGAADVAKLAMMFLARGGRAGYAEGGSPEELTDENANKGDLMDRVVSGLGNAMRYTRDLRENVIPEKVSELWNKADFSPRAAAIASGTNPEQHDSFWGGLGDKLRGAVNDAGDYAGTPPEERWMQRPGLGAAATPPMPSSTPEKGTGMGMPGRAPGDLVQDRPPPMPPAREVGPAPGLGAAAEPPQQPPAAPSTDVPPAAAAAEKAAAAQPQTRGYVDPRQKQSWFDRNQSWLVPMLKGVGTMAASPSRFLGAALLQGAGAAAASYEDVQNQMAKREQTDIANQAGMNALVPANLRGKVQAYRDKQTGEIHFKPITGQIDQSGAAPGSQPGAAAPAAAAGAPQQTPVVVKFDGQSGRYVFNVGPAQGGNDVATSMGLKSGDNIGNQTAISIKGMDSQNAAEEKDIQARQGYRTQAETLHKDLLTASDQAMLSRSGITALGKGHDALAPAVNTINQVYRVFGLEPPKGLNEAETADDIMRKVAEWNAARSSDAMGHASQHVQAALSAAFPSGKMTPESNRKLVLSLLTASQRERDFNTYARNYQDKYGVALGTHDSFNADMGQQYQKDTSQLEKMMDQPSPASTSLPDGTFEGPSMFRWIIENANKLTPDDKAKLGKWYGPDVLRWLQVG